MPSLKDLKNRIASVKATQKITKAMKMVAAAKLRRAQEAAEAARAKAERERIAAEEAARQRAMELLQDLGVGDRAGNLPAALATSLRNLHKLARSLVHNFNARGVVTKDRLAFLADRYRRHSPLKAHVCLLDRALTIHIWTPPSTSNCAMDPAVGKRCGCIRIFGLAVGASARAIMEVAKRVPIVQAASWAGIVIGVFRFGTEPFAMSKMFPATPDRW